MKIFERRDERVIPMVSFVGKSKLHKTVLLKKVVREIKSKGQRFVGKEEFNHDVQHG